MAKFKISGVWKNADDVITHYSMHTVGESSISRAKKTTKTDAVELLKNSINTAMTWVWDYQNAKWKDGENVAVINGSYLRSNPDNKLTDNLGHLIDYDWQS